MGFNSRKVPLQMYCGLTQEQFNQLEKSDDIFYQVSNVGLYRGNTLIAGVANSAEIISYIDTKVTELRNRVSAVRNADGTVTLTVGSNSYVLATPESVGSGGVEIYTPDDPLPIAVQFKGEASTEVCNWLLTNGENTDASDLFNNLLSYLTSVGIPVISQENYYYVKAAQNNGYYLWFAYTEAIESASTYYTGVESKSGGRPYFAYQKGKFVFYQISYNSQPTEEGVVVINNPKSVQTQIDADGGTIYIISTESGGGGSNPTGIEFDGQLGYIMQGQENMAFQVEAGSNTNASAHFIGNSAGYTITYSSSDEAVATVSSQGVVNFLTTGTVIITASCAAANLSKSVTFNVVESLGSFEVVGMGMYCDFITGQTWEQWIENTPMTINNGSMIKSMGENPFKIIDNQIKMGYSNEMKQQMFNSVGGTQEEYDEVFPFTVLDVTPSDLIGDTIYYFAAATSKIEADETTLDGEEFYFTLGGKSMRATPNMTLRQWINSNYNTQNFMIKTIHGEAVVSLHQFTTGDYLTKKEFENNSLMAGSCLYVGCIESLDTVLTAATDLQIKVFGVGQLIDPSFYISGYSSTIHEGESQTVRCTLNHYYEQESPSYTMTSSDQSVVSVSGLTYTGIGVGQATLTITCSVTNNTKAITVTVLAPSSEKGISENNPFTAEEAFSFSKQLEPNVVTDRLFYIQDTVTSVGRSSFGLGEEKAVRINNFKEEMPKSGDTVLISGYLLNYNNNYCRVEGASILNSGTEPEPAYITGYSASFNINPAYSPDPYVQVGGTKQLNPTIRAIYNDGTTNEISMQEDFYYTSDNQEVATVSNEGLVTGVSEGNVNIILHFGDDSKFTPSSVSLIVTTQDIRAMHFSASDPLPFVQGQTFAEWCTSGYAATPSFSFTVSDNKVGAFNTSLGGITADVIISGVIPSDVISDQTQYSLIMDVDLEQPEGYNDQLPSFSVSGVRMNYSPESTTETFKEFIETERNIMGLEILGEGSNSDQFVAYNLGPNMGNTRLPICNASGVYVRPNDVVRSEENYYFLA